MERTSLGTVLLLDADWSDIGNWKAIWENSTKDSKGNYLKGKILVKNVKNSFLRGEDRLLVGIDIEDLIIVETNDAVLVANKSSSQYVKEIVKDLEDSRYKDF